MMHFGTKRNMRWVYTTVFSLIGVLLIKIAELDLLQRIIHMIWHLPINRTDEIIYTSAFFLIMLPFIIIIFLQKKALQDAKETYEVLAEDSILGIYACHDGKITYANQHFLKNTGYSLEEIRGMEIQNLIHPDDWPKVSEGIEKKLKGIQNSAIMQFRAIRKNQRIMDLEAYGTVTTKGGKPYIIGSVLNISERKMMEEQLKELAYSDPLTGLSNRHFLYGKLQESLVMFQENRIHSAVLFLDLDGFKEVNDSYGHEIGDTLLKQAAARLLNSVRQRDIVSRLGGDEFIILLTNLTQDMAIQISERIIHTLRQPFKVEQYQIVISGSIGIAFYSERVNTVKELLRNADMAMYKAKALGKNRLYLNNESNNRELV